MTGGVAWLAAFLLFPLAGFPLLSHRAFSGLPLVSRAVLSGGAGAGLVSFVMTAEALLGVRWQPATLVAVAALLALGLRALLGLTAPAAGRDDEVPGVSVIAARLVAGAAVAGAFAAAFGGAASSPDLLFFWGPKAQQFALARAFDEPFMRGPFHGYMHSYYPPLVTNVFAFATMVAGRFSWTGAVLTFPLLLAALACGLPGVLRGISTPAAAAALSALVVAALGLIGTAADVGGNGEMPLLFFETLAVALLLSPRASGAAGQLLAGVFLAGAASAKVEAAPFVLSTAILFPFARPEAVRHRGGAVARLLLPSAVALAAWFAFGASRGLFYGYSEHGSFLDLHPDHFGIVLKALARTLAATGDGLPWLVPLIVLAAAWPRPRASLLPLGLAAVLTGFLLFTYIHREEDPSQWISWSAARVFSPVAMLLALAAIGGPARPPASAAEPAPPPERASPR